MANRVSARPAPVRNGFIERWNETDPLPPLAMMLRGGQGGEVRLKLLLSLLWFSVRPPHETEYPARGWAGLLDLPEPDTNGARRISAAIDWLHQHHFVRAVKHAGQPSTVYLRDERGEGPAYELPFFAFEAKEAAKEKITRDDYWVTLPAGFWTKGWIGVLSASAVAMLLVMLDEAGGRYETERLWHSPSQAQRRFGLSADVRSAGLRELEDYGIVTMHRTSINSGPFDFKRLRNVYDLHLEQLTVLPGERPPTDDVLDLKTVNAESASIDKGIAKAAEAAG